MTTDTMTTTTNRAGMWEPPPSRTLDQRHAALERANWVRSRRAQLKRDLSAGRVSAVALLLDPPEYIRTMKIIDLLLVLPKCGRVKASKALRRTAVSPGKTVGGLSERQRRELSSMLRAAGR